MPQKVDRHYFNEISSIYSLMSFDLQYIYYLQPLINLII